MEEHKYVVEIQRERGNISGCIIIQDKTAKNHKIRIDPAIFIADLANSFSTKKNIIDEDLIDGKVVLLTNIKKVFSNDLGLYDIEKLKIAFGIDLNYIVFCKKAVFKDQNSPKVFEWVRFTSDFDNKKGIMKLPVTHKYIYYGDSMASVILAIYHYLALNKYKPTICRHCGKIFFTQNLKNTLCERKTPYAYLVSGEEKKYSLKDKSCKEAVKTIRDRFRRRKDLLNMNYKDYGSISKNEKERALDLGAWPYMEAIKKEPSIKNLRAYEKYLYADNLTKREMKKPIKKMSKD